MVRVGRLLHPTILPHAAHGRHSPSYRDNATGWVFPLAARVTELSASNLMKSLNQRRQ
jgi:hypothetical protein